MPNWNENEMLSTFFFLNHFKSQVQNWQKKNRENLFIFFFYIFSFWQVFQVFLGEFFKLILVNEKIGDEKKIVKMKGFLYFIV